MEEMDFSVVSLRRLAFGKGWRKWSSDVGFFFLSQLKIQANFLNPVVYVIFSVCFCTSACTDKVFFSLLAAWTGKICCSLSIREFQIHK